MGDDRSSGSNAGVVIIIALLVLGLPCCGGVALLGLGVFSFRTVAQPAPPVMARPMAQPMMPVQPPVVDEAQMAPAPLEAPEGSSPLPTDASAPDASPPPSP